MFQMNGEGMHAFLTRNAPAAADESLNHSNRYDLLSSHNVNPDHVTASGQSRLLAAIFRHGQRSGGSPLSCLDTMSWPTRKTYRSANFLTLHV